MKLAAFMMSCRARDTLRAATLLSFARTDWQSGEVEQVYDEEIGTDLVRRINHTWRRMLNRALEERADFYLMMEDDLEFNLHLEHNLRHWAPLRGLDGSRAFFGSLYNPQRGYVVRDDSRSFLVSDPAGFWGTQAIVMSRAMAAYLVREWNPDIAADVLMARNATRVGPIYDHKPSLVQHTGMLSTWGGIVHCAHDYDPEFRATTPLALDESSLAANW